MTVLFAHHVEPHHLAIAAVLFACGAFGGWAGCARWLLASRGDRRAS